MMPRRSRRTAAGTLKPAAGTLKPAAAGSAGAGLIRLERS